MDCGVCADTSLDEKADMLRLAVMHARFKCGEETWFPLMRIVIDKRYYRLSGRSIICLSSKNETGTSVNG